MTRAGTGKTYASAFAMRELGFKRVLFLVHRNQIAKQAKKSFENVFGSRIKTGLVSGAYHDYDAEFVFATVQTLRMSICSIFQKIILMRVFMMRHTILAQIVIKR